MERTVHFAIRMDLCHLQNAEPAKHLQIYTERVVLGVDNVKDEVGYRAAFTEDGASASQMAAAKFFGHDLKASWYDWRIK